MHSEKLFSISRFAKFSRTTRGTLLFYDKIGLLSPVARGKNGYRYYSSRQLTAINLIHTCQELGASLDEIKELIAHRTPALIDDFIVRHIALINERIYEWVRARKLLSSLDTIIHRALDIDVDAITVETRPAEAIVLGDLNDYSHGRNEYDALLDFYIASSKKYPNMDLNYPVWGVFSEQRIKRGEWIWPDRYYFYNPDGYDQRPSALYVTGYCRGGYGQGCDLYERLMRFIDENGYEICGPAYEEYPLNEICILEPSDYLIRVMITVRKRGNRKDEGAVRNS